MNFKFKKDKISITVNSLHLGVIPGTDLSRDMHWSIRIFIPIVSLFLKSNSQGAATTVYAALSKDLEGIGSEYLADCIITKPIPFANDEKAAQELWDLSEKQTNTKYPF